MSLGSLGSHLSSEHVVRFSVSPGESPNHLSSTSEHGLQEVKLGFNGRHIRVSAIFKDLSGALEVGSFEELAADKMSCERNCLNFKYFYELFGEDVRIFSTRLSRIIVFQNVF